MKSFKDYVLLKEAENNLFDNFVKIIKKGNFKEIKSEAEKIADKFKGNKSVANPIKKLLNILSKKEEKIKAMETGELPEKDLKPKKKKLSKKKKQEEENNTYDPDIDGADINYSIKTESNIDDDEEDDYEEDEDAADPGELSKEEMEEILAALEDIKAAASKAEAETETLTGNDEQDDEQTDEQDDEEKFNKAEDALAKNSIINKLENMFNNPRFKGIESNSILLFKDKNVKDFFSTDKNNKFSIAEAKKLHETIRSSAQLKNQNEKNSIFKTILVVLWLKTEAPNIFNEIRNGKEGSFKKEVVHETQTIFNYLLKQKPNYVFDTDLKKIFGKFSSSKYDDTFDTKLNELIKSTFSKELTDAEKKVFISNHPLKDKPDEATGNAEVTNPVTPPDNGPNNPDNPKENGGNSGSGENSGNNGNGGNSGKNKAPKKAVSFFRLTPEATPDEILDLKDKIFGNENVEGSFLNSYLQRVENTIERNDNYERNSQVKESINRFQDIIDNNILLKEWRGIDLKNRVKSNIPLLGRINSSKEKTGASWESVRDELKHLQSEFSSKADKIASPITNVSGLSERRDAIINLRKLESNYTTALENSYYAGVKANSYNAIGRFAHDTRIDKKYKNEQKAKKYADTTQGKIEALSKKNVSEKIANISVNDLEKVNDGYKPAIGYAVLNPSRVAEFDYTDTDGNRDTIENNLRNALAQFGVTDKAGLKVFLDTIVDKMGSDDDLSDWINNKNQEYMNAKNNGKSSDIVSEILSKVKDKGMIEALIKKLSNISITKGSIYKAFGLKADADAINNAAQQPQQKTNVDANAINNASSAKDKTDIAMSVVTEDINSYIANQLLVKDNNGNIEDLKDSDIEAAKELFMASHKKDANLKNELAAFDKNKISAIVNKANSIKNAKKDARVEFSGNAGQALNNQQDTNNSFSQEEMLPLSIYIMFDGSDSALVQKSAEYIAKNVFNNKSQTAETVKKAFENYKKENEGKAKEQAKIIQQALVRQPTQQAASVMTSGAVGDCKIPDRLYKQLIRRRIK